MIFLERLVARIEYSKRSLWFFVWLWIVITTIRNAIEPISTGYGWAFRFQALYFLWYACMAMFLMVIVQLITKEELARVAKIVLFMFILIILAPIIDLVVTGGYQMEYFMPLKDDLWERYFYALFKQKKGPGASIGQRIEIGIVLTCSFIYFLTKTKSLLKSLLGLFAVYNVIFFLAALPFFLYWVSLLLGVGVPPDQTLLLSKTTTILAFIAINGVFIAWDRRLYWPMVKNLRWLRLMHYSLMVLVGMALAGSRLGTFDLTTALNLLLTAMAFIFAGFHAIAINDIHDIQIDKISNPTRPLVTKTISKKTYESLAQAALWLGLLYAAVAGIAPFIVVSLILFNYYLYSAPPLRLKKHLYFSKFIISANTLLTLLLGYHFAGGELIAFPKVVIAFVVILYTACINFIDIKDYEGDKKAKIRTIPTVMGLERSKILIGGFFVITYAVFSFAPLMLVIPMNRYLFMAVAMACGIGQFLVIRRQHFDEKPVFWIYEGSLVLLLIELMIRP